LYLLKVPKREIFERGFIKLSEPIWVGDFGTEPKIFFFHHFSPLILMVFGFLPHTGTVCAVKKKFEVRQKFKFVGGCFWAHMYAYNEFFEKF
jgi:hypothetical protein